MKLLTLHGRSYKPTIRADGCMTAYASIAYGSGARRGQLMCTVSLSCTAENPPTGIAHRTYSVIAVREYIQGGLPHDMQRAKIQFMLDIVALRQECQLHVAKPANPK